MRRIIPLVFGLALLFFSCQREGDVVAEKNPDTKISLDAINLTGEDRLNSVVSLSWMGTDNDGYVLGYEISYDQNTWYYTTSNDSTFTFLLEAGSDTTDIDFYLRSVDNDGLKDQTPAYLSIPLKNTPPVATIVSSSFPNDTANCVFTFEWDATDLDGDESIIAAYIKVNDGDWFEIDNNQNIITLIPTDETASGAVDANVYYGTNMNPLNDVIDGLRLNDTNTVYVKVMDLANSESEPDTSSTVFVKPRTADLLVISGQSQATANIYRNALNQVYPNYDFINYNINTGENQPKFWNPTFQHLINLYDKIFIHGDGTIFTNPINSQTDILIGYAAPFIQNFVTNGGKSLIISTFSSNNDLTNIATVMPFDSISSSNGLAVFEPDSSLIPLYGSYPTMNPNNFMIGVYPFYPTADATPMYRAEITSQSGWSGPDIMAASRSTGNNTYQVFFTAPLYQIGTDSERQDLLDQILNNDFNW